MPETKTAPTVLIVEDDVDARETFSEVLEEQGYTVVTAADGREAEAYLRSNPPPAAVVLDLMMPRLDGWAVAALMRQGQLPEVPIVVVTAATDRWGYPVPPSPGPEEARRSGPPAGHRPFGRAPAGVMS
jgi:CheY-like chemotaxis protein